MIPLPVAQFPMLLLAVALPSGAESAPMDAFSKVMTEGKESPDEMELEDAPPDQAPLSNLPVVLPLTVEIGTARQSPTGSSLDLVESKVEEAPAEIAAPMQRIEKHAFLSEAASDPANPPPPVDVPEKDAVVVAATPEKPVLRRTVAEAVVTFQAGSVIVAEAETAEPETPPLEPASVEAAVSSRIDAATGPLPETDPLGTDDGGAVVRQVRAAISPDTPLPQMQEAPEKGRVIELRLDPEELGRLSIILSHDGDRVAVHIVAERPETMDLLRRHVDQLQQEFRSVGYRETQMSFGQMDQGGNGPPPRPTILPLAEPQDLPGDSLLTPVESAPTLSPAAGGLNLRL